MERSRLPLDVCEKVIDHCYREPDFEDDYDEISPCSSWRTLFCCALTCQGWLTRSRFNLYTAVLFRRPEDIDSFAETITLHPFLGHFVRTLIVTTRHRRTPSSDEVENDYMPFGRTDLIRRMPRLHSLMFCSGDSYTRTYPPTFRALIARYPITSLTISVEGFGSATTLCRFLWTFTRVEHLHLRADISPIFGGRFWRMAHPTMTYSQVDDFRLQSLPGRRVPFPALKVLELE
ncbi:hypothetical protein OH77DRAFT_1097687 [Trametes cingulata]|nr:hypothetical protein OH77DRAFT_1097687 [Trametes cingulata]